MAQKKRTNKKKSSSSGSSANSLQKVREILFSQDREEARSQTSKIEKRLTKEVNALKADAKSRAGVLEKLVQDRVEALHELVLEEREARRRTQATLAKRITKLSESFEKKLSALRARLNKSTGDVRNQARVECEELRAEFDGEIRELRGASTDRAALSKLLGDVAKRLGNNKGG